MSYPPNSPVIICRSPQHGIHIAGGPFPKSYLPGSSSSPPSSPSPAFQSWPSTSSNACTILCVEPGCNNRIDVVPHEFKAGLAGMDSAIHIKARCKECEPPVIVPTWWEGHDKAEEKRKEVSSEDWADEF